MEWVALGFVFDLLCFCALIVFSYYRWHAAESGKPASEQAAGPAQTTANVPDSDWLDKLAVKLDDDIDCHSFRIEQIGVELRDMPGNVPEEVLKATARILIANRQLQRDLSVAHKEIQRQRQEVASLAAEARTDTLTGLPNRRSFNEDLARRFDQWRRHQIPVSLLMVDVDAFKKFNDTHGHQTGDEVLRTISKALRGTLRQMDLAARFGGEEFAILLPGTRLRDAAMVAERVRAAVAAESLHCGGQALHVTISVGLSSVVEMEDAANLIKRADEALYAAKNAGRNRAYLHDGKTTSAIAPDASVVRQPFNEMQYIAAYSGEGPLPSPGEFRGVQCHDLSARGLSFLCDAPPDFQKFVVRLGKGHETYYVVARIANIVDVGSAERPQLRVGCSFLQRVGDQPPAASQTTSRAPIVVADPQTGLFSFSTPAASGA